MIDADSEAPAEISQNSKEHDVEDAPAAEVLRPEAKFHLLFCLHSPEVGPQVADEIKQVKPDVVAFEVVGGTNEARDWARGQLNTYIAPTTSPEDRATIKAALLEREDELPTDWLLSVADGLQDEELEVAFVDYASDDKEWPEVSEMLDSGLAGTATYDAILTESTATTREVLAEALAAQVQSDAKRDPRITEDLLALVDPDRTGRKICFVGGGRHDALRPSLAQQQYETASSFIGLEPDSSDTASDTAYRTYEGEALRQLQSEVPPSTELLNRVMLLKMYELFDVVLAEDRNPADMPTPLSLYEAGERAQQEVIANMSDADIAELFTAIDEVHSRHREERERLEHKRNAHIHLNRDGNWQEQAHLMLIEEAAIMGSIQTELREVLEKNRQNHKRPTAVE